jgi:hypothetical protein
MAARTTVTSGFLSRPASRKALAERSSIQVFQGVAYSPSTGADQILIARFNQDLQRNGLKAGSNQSQPIAQLASDALGVAGISLATLPEQKKKNYSLIHTQLDTEIIENPSILNPSEYRDIEKRKITLETMFALPGDPFYTSDGPLSTSKQKQIRKAEEKAAPDLTALAVKMIQQANSSSQKTIRAYGIGRR